MNLITELQPLDTDQPEWIVLRKIDLKNRINKSSSNNVTLDRIYNPGSWKLIFLWNDKYVTQEMFIKYIATHLASNRNSNKYQPWLVSLINEILTRVMKEGMKKSQLENYEVSQLDKSNYFDDQEMNQILSLEKSLESVVRIDYPKEVKDPNYFIKDFLRYNTFIAVKSKRLLELSPIVIFIITRNDLKIGKGKLGAQIAHGLISLIFNPHRSSSYLEKIMKESYPSIELYSAPNLKVLEEMEKKAQELRINETMIADAGHTQVISGTKTVLAIGPAPKYYLEKFVEQWENMKRLS